MYIVIGVVPIPLAAPQIAKAPWPFSQRPPSSRFAFTAKKDQDSAFLSLQEHQLLPKQLLNDGLVNAVSKVAEARIPILIPLPSGLPQPQSAMVM